MRWNVSKWLEERYGKKTWNTGAIEVMFLINNRLWNIDTEMEVSARHNNFNLTFFMDVEENDI